MSIIKADASIVTAEFSRDEWVLLSQALNEACYGANMNAAEFATRLGVEREVAEALREKLNGVIDTSFKASA